MPPGNPEAVEEEAAAVARYATQAGDLAAATHRAAAGIVAGGGWEGKASDAYAEWNQGLVRGLGSTEEPLASVPHAVGTYAASLRTAQSRVTAYNSAVDAAGRPGTATSPAAQHRLAQLRADAERALAALEDAENESNRMLAGIAEDINHVFDASGPFSKWLDTVMRPWDSTAADVFLEILQSKGEKGLKDFEAAADWRNGGLSKALAKTMDELLKDPLTQAASRADLADAAASGDLRELDAALERWQNLRGAAQAFSDQWYDEPLSLLGKALPALKGLGYLTGAAGVIGGVYTTISPPSYDGGTQQGFDRAAGVASTVGGATGLAATAGVDFSTIAIGGALTLEWVPVAGQVIAVGAGLYLAGDWAYHHTHQIAHTFDTARHAAAHYADDVGHAASRGLHDITGGLL